MTIETAKDVLLWCLLINFGILMSWVAAFLLAREWIFRLRGRWFKLSVEHFDAIHYAGMAAYKIGVLLLNVAPLLALEIVGRSIG
jgi:hypothetical protein